MKRNRPLRPSERYFRHSDGTVNVAGNPGEEYRLAPTEEDTTYHISGLQLVLVGKEILTNHHRLGKSAGTIQFSHLVKDDLGIVWDRLNMYRTVLDSSRDWRISPQKQGVGVMESTMVAGKKPAPASLAPNIRQELLKSSAMTRDGDF